MMQTSNYGLPQLEMTDPLRMETFNTGNAVVDAELANLRRIVTNLAYHVGQLSIVDSLNRNRPSAPAPFAMSPSFCQRFTFALAE